MLELYGVPDPTPIEEEPLPNLWSQDTTAPLVEHTQSEQILGERATNLAIASPLPEQSIPERRVAMLDLIKQGKEEEKVVTPIVEEERQGNVQAIEKVMTQTSQAGLLDQAAKLNVARYNELVKQYSPDERSDMVHKRAIENARRMSGEVATVEDHDVMDTDAEIVTERQTLDRLIKRDASKADKWSWAGYIGANFLPLAGNIYAERRNAALQRIMPWTTGSVTDYLSDARMVEEFRFAYAQMTEAERMRFRQRLETITPEELGLIGDSAPNLVTLWSNLGRYEREDRYLEAAGNALTIFDIWTGVVALKNLSKLGAAARLQRSIGKKAAASTVKSDVLHGSNISGLEKGELPDVLISLRDSYASELTKRMDGLSSEAQAQMVQDVNTALRNSYERLRATARNEHELAAGLAELQSKWMSNTDTSIHAIKFGEQVDEAVDLAVVRQRHDGKKFASKAEADAYAEKQGWFGEARKLSDIDAEERAARKAKLETSSDQNALHGSGERFEEFRLGNKIGELGIGISVTKADAIAARFAQSRGAKTGEAWVANVTIPDQKHFLDLQLPFKRQSPEVQEALRKLLPDDPKLEDYHTGADIRKAIAIKHDHDAVKEFRSYKNSGIKGLYNKGGPDAYEHPYMGSMDEHLVFEPKDVQIQAWRKQDLESQSAIAQRLREEQTLDDWWMEEGNGNYLQSFQNEHLETLNANPKNKELVNYLRTYYDQPIEKAFVRKPGRQFRLADERIQNWVNELWDLLRLKNVDVTVLDNPMDVAKWFRARGRSAYDAAQWLAGHMTDRGTMTYIPHSGAGKNDYLIVVRQGMKWQDSLQVISHESSHMFDVEIFGKMPKAVRDEMEKAFQAWLKKMKGLDYVDMVREFRMPSLEMMKYWDNPIDVKAGLLEKYKKGIQYPHGVKKADAMPPEAWAWYEMRREFFAESMSKYIFTSPTTQSLFDKFMAGVSEHVQLMLKRLNQILGKPITPPDAMKKMMDDWIAGKIQVDESIPALRTFGSDLASMSDEAVAVPFTRVPGPVPGKPHIVPKRQPRPMPKPHIKPKATKEEWVFVEKRREVPQESTLGKFRGEDIESMPTVAIDPKHAASEEAYMARVVGVHAEAKVFNQVKEFLKPYFKAISKAGKKRVEAVLKEGDAASHLGGEGKEFNYAELMERGLSDKEAQAYFAVRSSRWLSHTLRDGEMTRALKSRGWQQLTIEGKRYVGKSLDLEAAKKEEGGVWDAAKGEVVSSSDLDLSKEYGGGRKLFVLDSPIERSDGKLYTRILGTADDVGEAELKSVLPYRKGEMSRIYSDEYFITAEVKRMVNGKEQLVKQTIRTAANAKEAAEYVHAVQSAIDVVKAGGPNVHERVAALVGKYYDSVGDFIADVEKGDLRATEKVNWHYDRQSDKFVQGQIDTARFDGRLFTSKRSGKLHSVDRTRQNTLDPYESLRLEMSNLSKVVNIIEWRNTAIQKWLNTFGDLLPKTADGAIDFYSFNPGVLPKTDKRFLAAKRTHAYIMRQIGTPTAEDSLYNAIARTTSEQLIPGIPVPGTNHIGAAVRSMSPINFVRSLNFNLTLGMWNPAQLFVQAAGAVTAIALHPIHGAKAAMTAPLMRIAMMSDNPQVWKWAHSMGMKLTGLSEQEFIDTIVDLRRSGLLENMQSTALWNKEAGKLGIEQGAFGRGAGTHLFFFNRGEEFSRMVSFDVARRLWIEKNPGKRVDTSALKSIIEMADDFTQNMTKANLARWQEGAMSIPLQFAQYNIKLALNVGSSLLSQSGKHGRSFTKLEAARLYAAHGVLYGAYGLGAGWALDEVFGKEAVKDLDSDTKLAIAQGLTSWVVSKLTGARTGIGSRLGGGAYFEQMVDLAMEGRWVDLMFGPTAGNTKRLGKVGEMLSLFWHNPNLTVTDYAEGIAEIGAENIASLRNITKAYLWHQAGNYALNGKGQKMAKLTPQDVVAQALGFSPVAQADAYHAIKTRKDHETALRDTAQVIIKQQLAWSKAINAGDVEKADRIRKGIQILMPESFSDRLYVLNVLKNSNEWKHDSALRSEMAKYVLRPGKGKAPFTITDSPKSGTEREQDGK